MVRDNRAGRGRGGDNARRSGRRPAGSSAGRASRRAPAHSSTGASARFEDGESLEGEHRGRLSYSAASRPSQQSRSRHRSTVPLGEHELADDSGERRQRRRGRHVASSELEAAAALAQQHVEEAEAAAARRRASEATAKRAAQEQRTLNAAPEQAALPQSAASDPFAPSTAVEYAPEPASNAASGVSGNPGQYSRNAADTRYHARKRGLSRGKKVLIAVATVLVVALGVGGFAFASWIGSLGDALKGDEQISNTSEATGTDPYYVLLLGGDSRADSKKDNRTDSIMVARVDEQNKKVSLVSVPRDLRVSIQGQGYHKINSAIEFGGYDSVVSKVNDVLGIQINYYAFIYFSGFKELVDKLGGVKVDVPEGTYYNGTWVPAGENVPINGKEALVLARCRHGNPPDQGAYAMGDYQRTLNQRNLIKAIGKKILQQDVTQLPDLIGGLASCVETNMSVSRIISLAQNMKGMNMDALDAAQLPIAGATIGGEWYAIMYKDVFDVMRKNFVNGKEVMDNLAKFDKEMNDSDIGSDYTDTSPYSYTNYASHWGEFKGKSKKSKK